MSRDLVTVRAVLRDDPRALTRLLVRCHARGWTPVSVHSESGGERCEVRLRLAVHDDRRGTVAQVRSQLGRLVGVERLEAGPAGDGRSGSSQAAFMRASQDGVTLRT